MDEKISMTEADMFQILRLWVEANPSDRKEIGKDLVIVQLKKFGTILKKKMEQQNF